MISSVTLALLEQWQNDKRNLKKSVDFIKISYWKLGWFTLWNRVGGMWYFLEYRNCRERGLKRNFETCGKAFSIFYSIQNNYVGTIYIILKYAHLLARLTWSSVTHNNLEHSLNSLGGQKLLRCMQSKMWGDYTAALAPRFFFGLILGFGHSSFFDHIIPWLLDQIPQTGNLRRQLAGHGTLPLCTTKGKKEKMRKGGVSRWSACRAVPYLGARKVFWLSVRSVGKTMSAPIWSRLAHYPTAIYFRRSMHDTAHPPASFNHLSFYSQQPHPPS